MKALKINVSEIVHFHKATLTKPILSLYSTSADEPVSYRFHMWASTMARAPGDFLVNSPLRLQALSL